jgi:hypothetical protein
VFTFPFSKVFLFDVLRSLYDCLHQPCEEIHKLTQCVSYGIICTSFFPRNFLMARIQTLNIKDRSLMLYHCATHLPNVHYGTARALKKCKQLFVYLRLLFLRDIWWYKL